VHDPGKVITDLTVTVAWLLPACCGGSGKVFGRVASDPVISRLVTALAGEAAPGAGGGPVTVDIDAHRDLVPGEGTGRADVEEDVRVPPADCVR
jgi:hypothetical protein